MQLEIAYDIPEGRYQTILESIKAHFEPRDGVEESFITTYKLEQIRNALATYPDPDDRFRACIAWDFAGHYARDLRLFPSVENADHETLTERYLVPAMPGGLTNYTLEMIGQRVNNLGDHPLVMRMRSDFTGQTDQLYILNSWYKFFREQGLQGMLNQIIDLRKEVNWHEQDDPLAGLPRSAEEFEEKIKKEELRLNLKVIDWSIGAVRFWWDFFGRPVKTAGYQPSSIKTQLGSDRSLLLSEKDLEIMAKYPSLEREEIAKWILSKPPDDRTLIEF